MLLHSIFQFWYSPNPEYSFTSAQNSQKQKTRTILISHSTLDTFQTFRCALAKQKEIPKMFLAFEFILRGLLEIKKISQNSSSFWN